jgi:DHA1 family tetracycline resistance protein-like MFS transporter
MTSAVAPSAQGELQGAMGSLAGIAMMIGPTLFATVFAYSIRDDSALRFSGAAYALAALLLAIAALIAERATRRRSPA